MQNFRALGALPPDPPASGEWGLSPQTPVGLRRLGARPQNPKTAPTQLRISGYAPAQVSFNGHHGKNFSASV